jgi:hypothetical protein
MVPTRVLLEGPAIEPLLAQVREEYGSGVRIVSADKVRSGGFGGFFAKQHYELSVEVPDSTEDRTNMAQHKTPTISPLPGEEPAHTLEQLLERAESHDRISSDEMSPYERPALERAPHAKQAAREAGIEDTEPTANAAFAELMAGLDVADQIATSAPYRPSPRARAIPVKSDDTPAVRPFRPATATGTPINSGGALPPVPSLAELMGGLGVSEADTPAFEAAKPGPIPVRSAAEAYGLNSPAFPALPASHSEMVIRNLVSVGMPEAMAKHVTGGDTYAGVLTALASRPAAPGIPDAGGEILVLAGDVIQALSIGKALLVQAGIDQTRLLLGGPSAAGTGLHSSRVMHTPKEAAARAEKLQTSDSAWIVVLDAPVGGTDSVWVGEMCDAIGATAVWAVVDATRKTPDTARHLRTLGEVEALVVHGADLTADPATVLGLDLPIVSLDGRPATPHAWAAMLCARIAADVTPQATAPRRQVRSAR